MLYLNQRAPRYRLRGLSVVYDTFEEFWSGPVINASASGLCVETAHTLPIGTCVTLMPQGYEDERLPFELQGVVVRGGEVELEGRRRLEDGPALDHVVIDRADVGNLLPS